MARVYVSLGSNQIREHGVRQAVLALQRDFGEIELSPVYDSAAVGFDGSNFLNLVVSLESELDAKAVVAAFRDIETQLGRDRSQPRFASRPIDIDLLLYDEVVLNVPGIRIPRPEILEHAFVLKPLQDIAPQRRHPETGESFADLWRRMAPSAPRLDIFPLDL
ncbi:MAG: 2-amino-4-hydroxy-6-hydroxymethyldihydropteridine diphosphokinase [Gammaproteobacteria bacterium]|nr:2-amino-4-hydroxy-6-hydroxymethyldihydropteridine diphosphokinase [Gammaproteobacteria bacterium]